MNGRFRHTRSTAHQWITAMGARAWATWCGPCVAALVLFAPMHSIAQPTDLIISEYIEGSSNNKFIELYNGTAGAINLANYQLRLHAMARSV